MTDPAIIAASYAAERNYSHNPDDVIDASDAVGAWGTAKESTTELVDLSGNRNVADIHGAMPTEGFIQGRRFTYANKNYLDCGNDSSLELIDGMHFYALIQTQYLSFNTVFHKSDGSWETGYWIEVRPGNMDSRVVIEGVGIFNWGIYPTDGAIHLLHVLYSKNKIYVYLDSVEQLNVEATGTPASTSGSTLLIGTTTPSTYSLNGICIYAHITTNDDTTPFFNTFAKLPFWSVNYTDYPDNVTEYTDNLPYSSSIILSGTFKVDDDKLQCVSAGEITYSASYEFDGSEFIKVTIDGVEYAGTGTITQGNTTVSVAQGSNKITITMGTADTIDGIDIQFREEV